MEFEKEVEFLGIEGKVIKKGDNAGNTFYIVKFLVDIDTFEISIFDDTTLINKLLKVDKRQVLICQFRLIQTQQKGLKLNLVDVVS